MRARHTGLTGSELIRLLAQWAGPQGEAPSGAMAPAFSTQLSQWLGWTDAVALASALDGGAAVGLPLQGDTAAQLLEEGLRVRAALAKALSAPGADAPSPGRWPVKPRVGARLGATIEEDPTDFATHRRRVHAQQPAMETAVSGLRARLRGALAAASPQHAKLAAVDAVMEQALLPQAQRLTSAVGVLLERRFRALQAAADGVAAGAATGEPSLAVRVPAGRPEPLRGLVAGQSKTPLSPPPSPMSGRGGKEPATVPAWLETFRQDLEAVLLAELDFRFQPIEGLMAALRSTLLATPEAALETT
ncbi:MAG: DUF3348 domain-containing protein [Rhizobacter sp.]